jgi:uncharacterized protein (TIGR02001 family)
MRGFAKACVGACVLLAATGLAATASAQSSEAEAQSSIELSGNVGLVSDYRYRGISLSDRDPAIQGGIDLSHKSGLFIGTWASSIADYGGSNLELDIYGGYAGQAAGIDYSLSVLGYIYPGGSGVDYVELQGTVGKTVGPAALELVLAYVPDQKNYPGDNFYIEAKAEVSLPHTPLTLLLRGGRESSDFIKKWDWEAGVSYGFDKLTLSLSYVDTNHGGMDEAGRLARAGVVASILAEF